MQRTCKQCGKEFTITQSEVRFYKSKHLDLPRRCVDCRKKNKMNSQVKNVSKEENTTEIKPSTTVPNKPSTDQETMKPTIELGKKIPILGIVVGIIAVIILVIVIAVAL